MGLTLVILISGRGSNMAALAKACQNPDFPADIAAVISNKAGAQGLKTAQDMGISTHIVAQDDYPNRDAFETALADAVDEYQPDLVCLAGFMRLLKGAMLDRYEGRILNVHPSLLPAYKGLNVHQRVIDAGERTSGCSVHLVTRDMDAGDVIVQKTVPVLPDDTPDTLAERILEQEHSAYPEAIRLMDSRMK